jgi:hypothetical protein
MIEQSQILLFGDLTSDYDSILTQLAARKDNPLLESFFDQVAFLLRAEIGAVSYRERERLGLVRFTTLVELLATLRNSTSPHPAWEKALTCTHQFARLIRYRNLQSLRCFRLLIATQLLLSTWSSISIRFRNAYCWSLYRIAYRSCCELLPITHGFSFPCPSYRESRFPDRTMRCRGTRQD